MIVSRRTLLLGAAATALAGCSSDGPDEGGRAAGSRVDGSFVSQRRGGVPTGWTIVYPPGHATERSRAGLPVLLALHGAGGDHQWPVRTLYLDRLLAGTVAGGAAPFAIATVDGGHRKYWHPRRTGDPAAMVFDEFLPLLADHGLDTRRIGLIGWSMGGYGALYLASLLGPRRCAVAVAVSPAIWVHSYQVAAGSFDDAADFRAHGLWGRLSRLAGIPLRVDCGASDGFAPATRRLRSLLRPTPAGALTPGAHKAAYWRGQAPAELAFAARHLA